MVLKHEDIIPTYPEPGITRRILARGGKLMGVEVVFQKGAMGSVHKHEHEQMSYIISGSFDYVVEGVTYRLLAGDSYYVDPFVAHGATALEDSVILDVFTPQREDFLV